MKPLVRNIGLALISLLLLALLASRTDLTLSAIAGGLDRLPGWATLIFVALIGANLGLAALKWLLVLNNLISERSPDLTFTDAFLTTTIGALFGQFIPFQLGVAIARSLAGKLGVGPSAGKNLGTTILEQTFDAIVLGAATATSVLALIMRLTPAAWVAQIAISVILVVIISTRLPLVLKLLVRLVTLVPLSARLSGLAKRLVQALEHAAALSPATLAYLAILSGLRYAANISAIMVLLVGLGMQRYTTSIAIAFPIIQAIAFVPITPGNLGVNELTWSAALSSAGAGGGKALLFAFALRIMYISAVIVLLVLLFSVCVIRNKVATGSWIER